MVEATGELNTHTMLKVPIAKIGAWAHPTYGTVAFTADDFDAAVANFNVGALGFEPHLTFGHLDEEPNSTDSARNRGGMKNLVIEGDGELNGYFAIPPNTSQIVREGGYTHASGEFIRDLMDKSSGKRLGMAISRVALTNTPYLPWGEEGKVQLLSQTGNSASDLVTSIVKLSTSVVETIVAADDTITSPLSWAQSTTSTSVVNSEVSTASTPEVVESTPVTEVGIDNMADTITEQTTPIAVPPAVVVPVELAPVITPMAAPATVPGIDIEALTAQIMAKMKVEQDAAKAERDAATEKANASVAAMSKEMAELKEKLAKTQAEASAFTSYASRAAEDAEKTHLMSMGASATLVNNYSAIKKALESQSQVVKLSQAGVEKESPLMDSIRELLEGALRQTPVVTTQMGLTGGTGDQQDGVQGYLEKVAEANRQKAKKVSI